MARRGANWSMPFYSIVMPVYNRADLVGATLDSIGAQTEGDWELIIVDDGSTDATPQILADYRARFGARMQVLQQSHAGPGAARNRAVAASSGRYVAFLDSDDLWFPETLKFYRDQLETHDFPAFLVGEPLVFGRAEQWQRALEKERRRKVQVSAFADYLQAQLSTDWLSTSSFVVRRDALQDKEFCGRAINCEDIDFTLQMGLEHGFIKVHRPPTFGYRRHAGGITGDAWRVVRGIEFLIAGERAGRYPGGSKRRRQRLNILGRHIRPALLAFVGGRYRRRAWRALKQTFWWHLELGRIRFLTGFVLRALLPPKRAARRNGTRTATLK